MKKQKSLVVAVGAALILAFGVPESKAKPFKRGMVFSGGGANTPMFLGMLDAAREVGKPIDVVVGACGGSIAAAIVNQIPSSEDQRKFVESREFFEFIKNMDLNDISLGTFIHKVCQLHARGRTPIVGEFCSQMEDDSGPKVAEKIIPPIFDFSLVLLDEINSSLFNRPFDVNPPGLPVVIIGGRLHYDESDVGKDVFPGEDLVNEVYFTDSKTAQYLEGIPSRTGKMFPNSFVADYTEVKTDFTLGQAVRTSIADPYLFKPYKTKDGQHFVTGAINIYGINVINALAEETVIDYMEQWDPALEQPVLKSVFGYDPVAFRSANVGSPMTYQVDLTKENLGRIEDLPNMTPGPGFKYVPLPLSGLPNLNRVVYFENKVKSAGYDGYLKMVNERWEYGKARAKEAFAQKPYTKEHIRNRHHDPKPNVPEPMEFPESGLLMTIP